MFNTYKKASSEIDWQSIMPPEIANKLLAEIESNPQACWTTDEIFNAKGPFGLCVSNPVPVYGIASNEIYLSRLRNLKGESLRWRRVRSVQHEDIAKSIDEYEIFDRSGETVAYIYISPYHWRTSLKPPTGFFTDIGDFDKSKYNKLFSRGIIFVVLSLIVFLINLIGLDLKGAEYIMILFIVLALSGVGLISFNEAAKIEKYEQEKKAKEKQEQEERISRVEREKEKTEAERKWLIHIAQAEQEKIRNQEAEQQRQFQEARNKAERAKERLESEQEAKREALYRQQREVEEAEKAKQHKAQVEQKAQREVTAQQQNRIKRTLLQESDTSYARNISTILHPIPNFWKIYEFNVSSTSHLHYTQVFSSLSNGTVIIQDPQTLINYVASYGGHHYHKLQTSCEVIFALLPENTNIEILDYGCGQALASIVFYDYMIRKNRNLQVSKITLIEPSLLALKRGILKLNHFIDYRKHNCSIVEVNKPLNDLQVNDLFTSSDSVKIHLFSNILDVTDFDYIALAEKIKKSQKGSNYLVCVSPFNGTAQGRIIAFQNCFTNVNIPCVSEILYRKAFNMMTKTWEDSYRITMFQRIFKYTA